MNNKIFVTGANSFVGSHLVNFLTNLNYEIHTLGTNPSIYGDFHKINFNEKRKLLNLINSVKPEAIIHLAGITRHKKFQKFMKSM